MERSRDLITVLWQRLQRNEYEKLLRVRGVSGSLILWETQQVWTHKFVRPFSINEIQSELTKLIIQSPVIKHSIPNMIFSIKEKSYQSVRLGARSEACFIHHLRQLRKITKNYEKFFSSFAREGPLRQTLRMLEWYGRAKRK